MRAGRERWRSPLQRCVYCMTCKKTFSFNWLPQFYQGVFKSCALFKLKRIRMPNTLHWQKNLYSALRKIFTLRCENGCQTVWCQVWRRHSARLEQWPWSSLRRWLDQIYLMKERTTAVPPEAVCQRRKTTWYCGPIPWRPVGSRLHRRRWSFDAKHKL